MPALFLTEEDVAQLVDMPRTLEVVEEGFRQLDAGKAVNVPRQRASAPGGILHTMSASAEYLGLLGWKAYTTTRQGVRFHVALYDLTSGQMLSLIEADGLGQLRTGAASGVATQFMARQEARTVGLLGSGKQARTQLQAVCLVRPIQRVEVYSPTEEHRRAFAQDMTEACQTEVVPVAEANQAATAKDIVITATKAKIPVFDGSVLAEGTHLNLIGSNFLSKTEIDVETVRRSGKIVCDSIKQCQQEAGDFVQPLEQGLIDWSQMHELADVVAGRVHGRNSDEESTLFKSGGLAVEDVALGAIILERARSAGLGQTLPV